MSGVHIRTGPLFHPTVNCTVIGWLILFSNDRLRSPPKPRRQYLAHRLPLFTVRDVAVALRAVVARIRWLRVLEADEESLFVRRDRLMPDVLRLATRRSCPLARPFALPKEVRLPLARADAADVFRVFGVVALVDFGFVPLVDFLAVRCIIFIHGRCGPPRAETLPS